MNDDLRSFAADALLCAMEARKALLDLVNMLDQSGSPLAETNKMKAAKVVLATPLRAAAPLN